MLGLGAAESAAPGLFATLDLPVHQDRLRLIVTGDAGATHSELRDGMLRVHHQQGRTRRGSHSSDVAFPVEKLRDALLAGGWRAAGSGRASARVLVFPARCPPPAARRRRTPHDLLVWYARCHMRALLPLLESRTQGADLYVCGHDHDLELIGDRTGHARPLFLISGAGSGVDVMKPRAANEPPTVFPQRLQAFLGFVVLDLNPQTLTITFFDRQGNPRGMPLTMIPRSR